MWPPDSVNSRSTPWVFSVSAMRSPPWPSIRVAMTCEWCPSPGEGANGVGLAAGRLEQRRPIGALEREVKIDQVVDRERRAVVRLVELGRQVPQRRRNPDG